MKDNGAIDHRIDLFGRQRARVGDMVEGHGFVEAPHHDDPFDGITGRRLVRRFKGESAVG